MNSTNHNSNATDTPPHVTVENLSMVYGDVVIQQDLSFTVNHGDIFIIMGGSGCGKTTLLKHIIGLKRPTIGNVYFENDNYWQSNREQQLKIKRRFGVMFQAGALWSSMTLAENIALPLSEFTELTVAEISEVVSFKLALVGLAGHEDYYPSELSGGMRKRASLARAMALDPEILFFDEPGAGLDPVSSRHLDDLILELRNSLGTTIVVVSHELASIFAIGNNSVFLDTDSKTMIATGDPVKLRDESTDTRVLSFLNRSDT